MEITIAPMVKPEVADAPYFLRVLEHLKNELDDNYHFIISRSNDEVEKQQLYNCIKKNKKNILILLSDEKGIIPPFIEEFFLIFRTYSNSNLHDNKKIFAVPCGFSCGFGGYFGNSDWCYGDMEKPKLPLREREYDIFYSAQWSPNRVECINQLNKVKNNFKSIVNITDGFAKGFKLEEYYELMSNSKISIVPLGAIVPESFRYFESFENNCIVITTYPKNSIYGNWFYENSPAIFLDSWSELNDNLIHNLLKIEKLNEFDILNLNYFNKNISTEGVSNYIFKKIKL